MNAIWPSRDGQFLITRAETQQPQGSVRYILAQFAVDIFGELPVTKVGNSSGRIIGALLGSPIDLETGLLTGELLIEQAIQPQAVDEWVEDNIYPLAGSFIFILDIPGCCRIYLDADGSKSLVYDPEQRVERGGSVFTDSICQHLPELLRIAITMTLISVNRQ